MKNEETDRRRNSGYLNEINYIKNVCKTESIPQEQMNAGLLNKPFSENRRGFYLMDIGQILKILPLPPARILDLAIGPGWTSKFYAMSGYSVVGIDIAPDMIELAKCNCKEFSNVQLYALNYEEDINLGVFDCAVIYDALHHSLNERNVIKNVYKSLKDGGILITLEPGKGHSLADYSISAIKKYGVTEKDMPFEVQSKAMAEAGFKKIEQYARLGELPLDAVNLENGDVRQKTNFQQLITNTISNGFSSIVVARK
jgi:2-polyprenyl-3-methyl-5-hydroxy-6-metoxy-1,4-benzoquinol methylase